MSKTMEYLQKFGFKRATMAQRDATPFDQRLQRLARIQPTSVARAVLFRTRPSHQEA